MVNASEATKKSMKITIDAQGVVRVDVQGATGSACLDWTAPLENDLGGTVSRELKNEFYEGNELQQSVES